jgi:hypothetical protein
MRELDPEDTVSLTAAAEAESEIGNSKLPQVLLSSNLTAPGFDRHTNRSIIGHF